MKYSVVIPLKDEESNIPHLIAELEPVMNNLGAPWELICIDDGSTDQTPQVLSALQKQKPYLQVITFAKNFGQSSAFDAGFRASRGEWVITMDGDRQNDPADIPKLIAASNGKDLVCGERVNRRDPFSKKATSLVANFVRSRICQDGVRDTGCSLKLYKKSSLATIPLYDGMHRFLPALFLIHGYSIDQVPVGHRERVAGKTKYNFLNRSFNTIYDMFAVAWINKRLLRYQVKREEPHG